MLRLGLVLALVVAIVDQAVKAVLLDVMAAQGGPVAVTGFFNLVTVWNRGVSFGLFNRGEGVSPWLFIALAAGIVAALVWWLAKARDRWLALLLGLVIGGAAGNMVDRLRFGAVADFFDLHLAGWHWPAFNVADAAISVGVALLLLDALLRRGGRRR